MTNSLKFFSYIWFNEVKWSSNTYYIEDKKEIPDIYMKNCTANEYIEHLSLLKVFTSKNKCVQMPKTSYFQENYCLLIWRWSIIKVSPLAP